MGREERCCVSVLFTHISEELDVPSVTSRAWKLLASACAKRQEGILRLGGGEPREAGRQCLQHRTVDGALLIVS